jgi:formamidopyrimidine-DNA glycosylase
MAFELPEVIKISGQLNLALNSKVLKKVHLSDKVDSLIKDGFLNLHKVDISNMAVESVYPKGKCIFIKLKPNMLLLLGLETTGKLLYHKNESSLPDKYHVKFEFDDGSYLTEHVVGWGWAKAVQEDKLHLEKYPGELGISPLDDKFSLEILNSILDELANKQIKFVILQQDRIAGIGNGYLQDILFHAKIHPKRKAGDLNPIERKILYKSILDVMTKATEQGGCDTEFDLFSEPGSYVRLMDRRIKDQPCPTCKTHIVKINVGGSSCYVCPNCQKS